MQGIDPVNSLDFNKVSKATGLTIIAKGDSHQS
jgi:hypothetical protein